MTMEVSGILLSGFTGSGGGGGGEVATLSELADVSIQGVASTGQYLRYNGTTKLWNNSLIDYDVSNYIQRTFVGVDGISVNTQSGTHTIGFDLRADGDVKPTTVVNGVLRLELADANNAPGIYGSGTQVPVISVDAAGRVTHISTVSITASAGTVTYVAMSGGTTGLTVTGGPVMSSGQFTLGGRLNTTSGGTGASGLTGYVVANGANPFTAISSIPGSDILGDIPGTSASAHMLKTPRVFTIGQSARTFDGTSNISWTLPAIGAVNRNGDKLQGALDFATPAQIQLSAVVDLGSVPTNLIEVITGTGTTINSFGLASSGVWRKIVFSTTATIVHSSGASGIRLPGGLNMQVNPGDVAEVVSIGVGLWSCVVATRAVVQMPMIETTASVTASTGKHYLVTSPSHVVSIPSPGVMRGARIRISNVSGTLNPTVDFGANKYRGTFPGPVVMGDVYYDIELTDSGNAAIGWI